MTDDVSQRSQILESFVACRGAFDRRWSVGFPSRCLRHLSAHAANRGCGSARHQDRGSPMWRSSTRRDFWGLPPLWSKVFPVRRFPVGLGDRGLLVALLGVGEDPRSAPEYAVPVAFGLSAGGVDAGHLPKVNASIGDAESACLPCAGHGLPQQSVGSILWAIFFRKDLAKLLCPGGEFSGR